MKYKELNLTINGRTYQLNVRPGATLAEVLRDELLLLGTKVACDKGSCGTCTVLIDGMAVKSCSVLALQADQRNVLTIEGVANGNELHPIQKTFIKNHGLQCGFCTPGFILGAKALLEENPEPTEDQVRVAIQGHICRCGTYPNIVKSILDAAKVMRGK